MLRFLSLRHEIMKKLSIEFILHRRATYSTRASSFVASFVGL